MQTGIKTLKMAIPLSLILIIALLASNALSISCCRSDSRHITSVTTCAQIEGTNPDNSYGYAKGISSGDASLCRACVWDKALFETYSERSTIYRKLVTACPYGTGNHSYGVGSAGDYVFSYMKSFCDGPEASVTAFLYGYCAVLLTEG